MLTRMGAACLDASLLLLLRTRSSAIGAETLSLSCYPFAFFGRATPDRAGARPYQLNVRRRIVRERVPASLNGVA